jgi:hypothetical protein
MSRVLITDPSVRDGLLAARHERTGEEITEAGVSA